MEKEQVNTISNRVSTMASGLQGSEIIRLAGDINAKINAGKKIYNFTIGDFNPEIFPIPEGLQNEIIKAYQNNQTNYPAANGILPLRETLSEFIKENLGLSFSPDQFLVAGGARPLIYAAYRALVDKDENILFPVPSWNNNHYSHLAGGNTIMVETKPENNFMPTADELKPFIQKTSVLALCSPLNPTGTVFSREGLLEICNLVLEENKRRGEGQKPLYIIYDQIYWMLTYGDTKHEDPVSLVRELKPYTIYIDGISKSLAATGVRVGWAFGPDDIISKMKSILGHVGAWAPKAEQVATAFYLSNSNVVETNLSNFKALIHKRLNLLHEGFQQLKESGFPVDSIKPAGAIYLTVKFDLTSFKKQEGGEIKTAAETTSYLLNDAGLAIVPFYAFGASTNSPWFRLSVGTLFSEQIPEILNTIQTSLQKLSKS